MPYDVDFIPGYRVRMPLMSEELIAVSYGAGAAIDHEKFSIYFHQGRHLAIMSAYNVDGSRMIPAGTIERKSFVYDPSLPSRIQIDNDEGYRNNPWDRGHLARRRALQWGDLASAEKADRESSYWSNIAPQHEGLHDSAWGRIEDWLLELVGSNQKKMSVFVGPVFTPHDPQIVNIVGQKPVRIPAGYWKVAALNVNGRLRAAAFITWQRDHASANPVEFDPVLEQVRLTTVEYLTGLSFSDLTLSDPLRFRDTEHAPESELAESSSTSSRPNHGTMIISRLEDLRL